MFSERGFMRGVAWIFLRLARSLRVGFSQTATLQGDELPVEVVYVAAEKDLATLGLSIQSLDKLVGVQVCDVVIIAKAGTEIESYAIANNLTFVSEEELIGFGPSRYRYPTDSGTRSGWLYQQLLKLAWSEHSKELAYIIVDADTVFVSEVAFVKDNKYRFFLANEWHPPYSKAFEFLLGMKDRSVWSYVAHMMIFDVAAVKSLRNKLELIHGVCWHDAIAQTRALHPSSCFSEYHTYAAWFRQEFNDGSALTPLYNKSFTRGLLDDPNFLKAQKTTQQTVSLHEYFSAK